MKNLLQLPILLLPLLIGGCSDAPANKDEATTISFKFPPGARYEYSLESEHISDQSMGEIAVTIKQNYQTLSGYLVEKGDSNNKKLTVVQNRVYLKTTTPHMSVEYDSADSTRQNEMLGDLGTLVGKSLSLIVDEKGEVLDRSPLDSAKSRLLAANMLEATTPSFDNFTSRMLEQALSIYPSAPVGIGSTWQRTHLTNVGGIDLEAKSEYKLVSVKDDIANIEVKGTIKSTPASTALETEHALSGTQTGTLKVDVNTGLIIDGKLTQNVTGTSSMSKDLVTQMKLTTATHLTGKMK